MSTIQLSDMVCCRYSRAVNLRRLTRPDVHGTGLTVSQPTPSLVIPSWPDLSNVASEPGATDRPDHDADAQHGQPDLLKLPIQKIGLEDQKAHREKHERNDDADD